MLTVGATATRPVGGERGRPGIVPNMPTMPRWMSVTWPQRGLVVGALASALVVATGAVPKSLTTPKAPSVVLWGAVALNVLLLLVLGPTALVTTRRWFRQGLPIAQLRRQRRAVCRRAVVLGLVAYLAHQALVVLLDPRFSLEALLGRRRVFGGTATFPDRLELAWAFTAVAFGYIVLAWLLWRSASVPALVPSAARSAGLPTVLGGPPTPVVATPSTDAVEVLPRDPVTGRVVRQFDVSS